jgi:ubiquinone/menaquinone biosynthesis C-methylase UbiE
MNGADPTELQHRRQKRYFDRAYGGAGTYTLENWRQSYLRRIFPELGMGSRLKPGFRYLDVGVGGNGYTVIEAARLGCSAWGVDLSEVGVASARRLAAGTLPPAAVARCRFEISPAETLPFKAGWFDAVSSIAVLEHVAKHEQAMAEIVRVLKPGGKAYLAVPHTYRKTPFLLGILNRVNDRMVGHLRHYTPADLAAPMQAAGAEPIKTIYHAHSVKLTQFLHGLVDRRLGRPGSEAWWRYEQKDLDAWQDDRASMLSMVFRKRRGWKASGKKKG